LKQLASGTSKTSLILFSQEYYAAHGLRHGTFSFIVSIISLCLEAKDMIIFKFNSHNKNHVHT